MILQFLLGLVSGIAIAYAAYRVRSLNLSGAIAAALLGTVVFGLGGLPWAVVLMTFFISSSVLSRLFKQRKAAFDEKFSKGSRRDAGQVLANGGVGGVLVLAFAAVSRLAPAGALPGWLWLAYCASLAAANADTWATELGVLSRKQPVLITTGQPVAPGTSGGVSLAGTLEALAGASLVALAAWALELLGLAPVGGLQPGVYVLVALAGLAGSLFDSLLGATVQAIYFCPACQKETERHPLHLCGTPTVYKRGWPWLNNDWVNTACTALAALLVLVPWLPAAARPNVLAISGGRNMTITINSTAFANGDTIPAVYTCLGENRSPDLTWSDLPEGARSLALMVDDPDAPFGTFTHWVVYNMPPTATGLSAGQPKTLALKDGSRQGKNSFRKYGYDGPCPPPGKPHRYFFRLYALDLEPTLEKELDASALRKAIQGHVLAQGEWMGSFGR